jgi:nicotinamidase-related amidase
MEETATYTSPLADKEESALIVVDLQDAFLAPIADREKVINRSRFMIEVANLFGIPILVTEQYPARMGGTTPHILELLPPGTVRHDKLCFSSCGIEAFQEEWAKAEKTQAVIVGIETHICVTQTVHDFLANEIEVFVCADATAARGEEAHGIAIERMRQAGAIVTHTESVAYEWLKSAESDEFKSALEIVKRYS